MNNSTIRILQYLLTCIVFPIVLRAQITDTTTLATKALDSVTIRAYGSNNFLSTPAAVNFIGAEQLARYANFNVLQAVNSVPGVRLEERSFGSYRVSIRGSSLRSPYGVRNVKIYYDEIPFTAPGGNSMFNMLGFYNFGSLEIIKGLGGSRYGAGTGGVLLLNAPKNDGSTTASAGITAGSYGAILFNVNLQYNRHAIGYEQSQTDGYREHTAMKKQIVSYSGQLMNSRSNSLRAHLIYSDLNYQTPGALTLAEHELNPKSSRPAAGPNPSAINANASIRQKATFLGLHNRYAFSKLITNSTTLYGFYNETTNPAIQNVEDKEEPHWGGRTVFNYKLNSFSVDFGGEFQQGDFKYKTYQNLSGNRGSLRTDDRVKINQLMAFTQLDWRYCQLLLTAGASVNRVNLIFNRTSTSPAINATKTYAAEVQPRFAASYQLASQFSIYTNIVKGFSPPASSEIFADNSSYNLALKPEQGWSFEQGFRGAIFESATLDLSVFTSNLSNSIVTRRDAAGANYYLNAGKIKQQGVEASLSYRLLSEQNPLSVMLHGVYALHHFKYVDFVQLNQDFSGNKLPGVAPHTFTTMADVTFKNTWSAYLSYSYSDRVALNDANLQYANRYQLLSFKLAYRKDVNLLPLQVFAGADNLLNQTYSLGDDINGFGGRYYNAAPKRTFYLGVKVGFNGRK